MLRDSKGKETRKSRKKEKYCSDLLYPKSYLKTLKYGAGGRKGAKTAQTYVQQGKRKDT